MKSQIAPTPKDNEELELLALEVSELRAVLREVSLQVLRIERRIRSVLPNTTVSARSRKRETIDSRVVKSTIKRLTDRARNGVQIENELRGMTVKHELAAIARELGMTNRKLPPKDSLIRSIATRIRQRASMAYRVRDGSGE